MDPSYSSSATPEPEKAPIRSHNQDAAVLPSADQVNHVLASSTHYWKALAQNASSMQMTHDTVQFDNFLHRIPPFPKDIKHGAWMLGQAFWKVRSATCEDSLPERGGQLHRWVLDLPSRRPTRCSFSDSSDFSFTDSPMNGVAILCLGWAYILSASLLEKQELPMVYSALAKRTTAEGHASNARRSVQVYIGQTSKREARWWKSLLSPGQGWCPTGDVRPPWTVELTGNIDFVVTAQLVEDPSGKPYRMPPSAIEAMGYLTKFATAYGIESQSPLALAMALSLPIHNQTRTEVQLPEPTAFIPAMACWVLDNELNMEEDFHKIPFYMTISTNTKFFASALWSIFWEPDVECNLVSAWTEPIIQVIGPLVQRGNNERLAHLLAQRRPNIAPLWYGVLACGKTALLEGIITFLRTLTPPTLYKPMSELAAWTGCCQSFIDVVGSGPYVKQGEISRDDVFRLRHQLSGINQEFTSFTSPPPSPWKPFGAMLPQETEITVQNHLDCSRHQWDYSGWIWCVEGHLVFDAGYKRSGKIRANPVISPNVVATGHSATIRIPVENMASERATRNTFRWAAHEMEVSGRAIYSHPWVQDGIAPLPDDDAVGDEVASEPAPGYNNYGRAVNWLEGLTRLPPPRDASEPPED